jgi:D-alanyl-D-alanine carboxypeptidase/D-alanyl-D-alanine-endopeptidase (penicillin-binding protein 4)
MKKIIPVVGCLLLVTVSFAQNIDQKLQKTYQQFESDSQLKHAINSLYVIETKTGNVVFDKNSQVGLAPASTQKIITAATAFELLGKDYRYKTELGYDGYIEKDSLKGNIYIIGSGDPTFGSWRYKSAQPDSVLKQFYNSIAKANIRWVEGSVYINEKNLKHKRYQVGGFGKI